MCTDINYHFYILSGIFRIPKTNNGRAFFSREFLFSWFTQQDLAASCPCGYSSKIKSNRGIAFFHPISLDKPSMYLVAQQDSYDYFSPLLVKITTNLLTLPCPEPAVSSKYLSISPPTPINQSFIIFKMFLVLYLLSNIISLHDNFQGFCIVIQVICDKRWHAWQLREY